MVRGLQYRVRHAMWQEGHTSSDIIVLLLANDRPATFPTMRCFRSWLFVVASTLAGTASAQQATSLYFFGDSLTDEGRNGRTAPVIWAEVLRNDLSITTGQNFAIGGATSGNQASAVFGNSGFLGQVNMFVAGGPYANAEAGVWIGINDIQAGVAANVAPATIAARTAQNVRTGLTQIVGAGVNSVALLGVYDQSLTNAGANTIARRDASGSASALYNAQLAALTIPGATVQFYNIANFINQLQVNARAYGFTQILPLQAGQACDATCQQTSIFDDTIHLSSKAQALIGNYVASGNPIYNSAGFVYGAIEDNIASSAVAANAAQKLAAAAADQFGNSLLDRLDATRGLPYLAADQSGRPNHWTVYAYGGGAGDTLAHIATPTGYQDDIDATLGGVTAGAEYRVGPAVRIGVAFNYAHATSYISSGNVNSRIDSFQGALYASATYPSSLFVDGIIAGGGADLSQDRNGGFGQLHGSPSGTLFTATGRVGYLLPVGPVKLGPVGGLLYSRSKLDGSGESGSSFFAVDYTGSTLSSFYGDVGVEARLTDPAFLYIDPFVTLTYNRQFDRGGALVGSSLAFLPTQALPTGAVTANLDFVKLAVGSTFDFGSRWYGTVTAFGLKGQQSLAAGGGNVGLAYRF